MDIEGGLVIGLTPKAHLDSLKWYLSARASFYSRVRECRLGACAFTRMFVFIT